MSHITIEPCPRSAKTGLFAFAILALAACSTPNVGTEVATTGMVNPEIALRESIRLVDAEMTSLGTLGGGASRFSDPVVPGELQKTVTFTYAGPLEDGVRRLADEVGYKLTVSPPPPPAQGQAALGPLTVSVSTGFVTAYAALKALGDAAGSRAIVRVDPQRHLVEVIYNA